MQFSSFLRTVLKIDAASCLAMAVLLVPAAGSLRTPLGIDPLILQGAGLVLFPLGLFILWLGTRRAASAALVWLVIVGNIGWTLSSFAAASAMPGITLLGQAIVLLQAIMVLVLAYLEWHGLRSIAVAQSAQV